MFGNKEEKQTGGFKHPDDIELHHTDKLVGLFLHPSATFNKISKERLKNTDWIIPLLLLIIVTNIATIVMMSNPDIKFQMSQNMIESSQKQLNDAVADGNLTRGEADRKLEETKNRLGNDFGGIIISQIIGIAVFTFIIFFVTAGFYFIFSKYLLEGSGNYLHALVGYGLPFYISILQAIAMAALAFSLGKIVKDTSVATFINADRMTFAGFLLSKLDVFSIWFYSALSIAYARLFKSNKIWKYFLMMFGLWILLSALFNFTDAGVQPLIEFIGDKLGQ